MDLTSTHSSPKNGRKKKLISTFLLSIFLFSFNRGQSIIQSISTLHQTPGDRARGPDVCGWTPSERCQCKRHSPEQRGRTATANRGNPVKSLRKKNQKVLSVLALNSPGCKTPTTAGWRRWKRLNRGLRARCRWWPLQRRSRRKDSRADLKIRWRWPLSEAYTHKNTPTRVVIHYQWHLFNSSGEKCDKVFMFLCYPRKSAWQEPTSLHLWMEWRQETQSVFSHTFSETDPS